MKRSIALLLTILLSISLVACASPKAPEESAPAPAPTEAAKTAEPQIPTASPAPTDAPATPEPTVTPVPTPVVLTDDFSPLLGMKRSDVEALLGKGASVVYETFLDYDSNGEALMGFPVMYEQYPDIWVFYDAEEPDDQEKSPYKPNEKPTDEAVGIKLVKTSGAYNVKGYSAQVPADVLSKHKNSIVLGDQEHKYYYLDVELDGVYFMWLSKSKDMTDSWVFACDR